MTDVLGWRRKFGVIGPSTNTVVQPDFDDMRPAGVTHYSRIFTPNADAVSNDSFRAATDVIAGNVLRRFRNVGDPRRTDRFKSTYEYGVRSSFVVHGIAAYERAFKALEATLVENRGPWILGSDPTLADINLMPYAARLDYLGLLDLWIKGRRHASAWWNTAREWPSFKSGLRDLISEPEFSEMRIHGPKIANDVAEIIAEVRDSMSEMGSKGDVAPSTEPRN